MGRSIKSRAIGFISFVIIICANMSSAAKNEFEYRLFFEQGNMMRRSEKYIASMKRAAGLGFNGIVCVDLDLDKIEDQKAKFFDKYKQALQIAKSNNIQMIPCHFTNQNPSWENHNLAETFPVKGTKFVVSGDKANAVGDHEIGLKNGGFESFTGNKPASWALSALKGENFAIDKTVKRSGNASFRVDNAPQFSTLKQTFNVKPFRAYRISGWFKTKGLANTAQIQFSANGKGPLLHRRDRPFGAPHIWSMLSPTMHSWGQCMTDFNSLNNTKVTLTFWFTYSSKQTGTLWADDFEIREVGLYEVVRGKSKPITVKSLDGSVTYKEGTDYIVDPRCNNFTTKNYYHEGHLQIPAGSRIKDKQELRVDWFQYANVETMTPPSDFCLPEVWTTLQDDLNRIDALYGNADAMFLNNTEWRIAGWNEQCESFQFKTGGDYLAHALAGTERLLRSTKNGCRRIFSWSDMFDSWHNSWNPYWGCRGGAFGAVAGLSDEHFVANWNGGYTKESLMFFAGLDTLNKNARRPQILCFFYAQTDAQKKLDILDKVEPLGVDNVKGCLFSDWYNSAYQHMEPVVNVLKSRGRWGSNPFPAEQCEPTNMRTSGPRPEIAPPVRLHTLSSASRDIVLEYRVPESKLVALKVFDLFGREIQALVNAKQPAGTHRLVWNSERLPAGVYVLHLNVEDVGKYALKQIVH